MGKHKNTTKEREGTQKGASPTLSSHGGEQGDIGDTAEDLMEEVALMEEVFSQISTPSNRPFRFTQLNGLPSE